MNHLILTLENMAHAVNVKYVTMSHSDIGVHAHILTDIDFSQVHVKNTGDFYCKKYTYTYTQRRFDTVFGSIF